MATILVVDDTMTDRVLIGGLLQTAGQFTVSFAENGSEALDRLEQGAIDAVVTDLQMPVLDGLELVRQMRVRFPLIPVVLITAAGSERIAVQALQEGAAGYVRKKSLKNNLIETVNQVLEASKRDLADSEVMQQIVLSEFDFVLATDLSLLGPLVRQMQRTMRSCCFCDEKDLPRLGVALDEALMNAYYHGNLEIDSTLRDQDYQTFYNLAEERAQQAPYSERKITLYAELSATRIQFVVEDEGPGFDVATLPDPTDPGNIERPSGRGVLLMRMFMDEVRFSDKGNRVTLVKNRNPPDADGPPASA